MKFWQAVRKCVAVEQVWQAVLAALVCILLGWFAPSISSIIPHKNLHAVTNSEHVFTAYSQGKFCDGESNHNTVLLFRGIIAPVKELQHTLGHLPPCPACEAKRAEQMVGFISPEMKFADAAKAFAESKESKAPGVRYVSNRTLQGYEDFRKPLTRFFAGLRLNQIHHGHLRTYQEQRAMGMLGPSDEELFSRVCKWEKVSPVDARANPILRDYIERRVAGMKHTEVKAEKINQELSYLVRIMRRAQCWTPELEEHYEPLRAEESDIPKALTREQQSRWLATAGSREPWLIVYYYSLVAFDSTASNVEMRNIRLGDLNPHSHLLNVRAATAKNKFRIRSIALNPDAWIAIEWLQNRAYQLGARAADDFLFPFRVNTVTWDASRPMSAWGLKNPWQEVVKASGVHLTQHGCRHTAITRYAEAGVPIHVIMARAGHISPKMTSHYVSISTAAQRWAMEAVYRGEMYPVSNSVQNKPVQNAGKSLNVKAGNFS